MSEQNNIQTVKNLFEAFGRGDLPYIVDHVTADIQWRSHLDPAVPWAGEYSSPDRVPKFFQALYETVDIIEFNPTDFVAGGDSVVTLGTFECRSKATGRSARTRWNFVWKFRDGKVYSYELFNASNLGVIFA